MQQKNRAKLIEGGVANTLITLTIPMLLAVITMVAFNLVDTYFVGQLGTVELAAMGFTIPIVFLVASLSQGLGVGISAVIARAIGEGDTRKVQRLATDGIILALLIVIVVASIGLMTIDPLFTALGANADSLPFVRQYMSIWYFAVMFLVIPMVGNATIRATGDTKTPAMIMLIAVGINIVLDPMLIFGFGPIPAMGIQGAALATLLSRMATMLASMYILIRREKMITLEIPRFADVIESWKKILYIGVPAAGTQMLVPISTAIITRLVAGYGNEAVAAYNVGSRVEVLALALIMALSGTLTPFVAQNWGAGKTDRVRLAARYSNGFAIIWGLIAASIFALSANQIGAIFNDDPAVLDVIRLFLYLVPVSYGLQGVLLVVTAVLNALNRPFHATILMGLRLLGLYVPFAIILTGMFDLAGVFGAATVANSVAGIVAWIWLQRVLNTVDAQPAKVKGISAKVIPDMAGD